MAMLLGPVLLLMRGAQGDPGDKGDTGVKGVSGVGTFCGATDTTDGSQGGYATMKAACETACGTATAHICSSTEMVTSASSALLTDAEDGLWYASGMLVSSTFLGDSVTVAECGGFTTNNAGVMGPLWMGDAQGVGSPSLGFCNDDTHATACCD